MDKEIINHILAGEFKQAHSKINKLNKDELRNMLLLAAYDLPSITFYGFVNYLNLCNKDPFYHDLASDILTNPLSQIKGAYQTALFHTKQAKAETNH